MTEWILAFDAGCGRCTKLVEGITEVVGERLAVAGLGENRIRALRQRALGDQPPFAPTLLAVDVDRVRAWTGPRMSARLALLLGPRRSLAVVRALDGMDVVVHGDRRRFLKAVPGLAVGAFLLSGGAAAPAMASPGRRSTLAEAQEWAAQLDRLPTGYDDFSAHSVVRRRAVFARLSPEAKTNLWVENIERFRLSHPNLNAEQSAVLGAATALVPAVFSDPSGHAVHADLELLESRALETLGPRNTFAALAMLGSAEPTSAQDCWCHVGSRCSCPSGHKCRDWLSCDSSRAGCGCFWIHSCNGAVCEDTG